MKAFFNWRTVALFPLLVALFGCAETAQLVQSVGSVASEYAYQDKYNKEYKKARQQGMSDAQAQQLASQKAKSESSQKQQLFEGVSDVFVSVSDIDYNSERVIGETLAFEGFKRYGMPAQNQSLQDYVNLLGSALARNSTRSNIPYNFIVVNSPIYNAFSCPGGIIFISSALVQSMNDESELAGVLAHEIAHVAHKHALKSLKRARFFEGGAKIATANMKGDKGQQYQQMVGSLQTILFDQGLDKSMEFEADMTAMDIVYRTGYDPSGLIRVLNTLQAKEAMAQKSGSWFSTHPPLSERISKSMTTLNSYPNYKSMSTVKGRFNQYVR